MVSACLITWKRQENLARIVPHLLSHDWIDEVIIHDNSKGENIINYGRYTSAMRAKNDLIYVQDDDAIIHGLDDLYEAYMSPERESKIVYGSQAHMQPEWLGPDHHMAIVGWGTIFDRSLVPVLNKYTDVYGQDYCFYRETDRIFTVLLGGHHQTVHVEVEHLPGFDNEDALSVKGDHIEHKELAIKRALELVE